MRNNTDQFLSFCHVLEDFYCLISGMFIQWSKAFVDEHHIKVDRCGTFLDLICHAKCQGKCRHKGLATGERSHFTDFSGHSRINHQIQTSVFACSGFVNIAHPQFKLSCGHVLKSLVCRFQDLLQIMPLYICFDIHSGVFSVSGQKLIQSVYFFILMHHFTTFFHLRF